MKTLSGYINIVPFFKVLTPAMTWKKRRRRKNCWGQWWDLGRGCSTGESGSWDMICCLTVNLYNIQLILHIQYMHALPPPLLPHGGPIPWRWHCTKTDPFFFCFFLENLYMWTFFDFRVSLVMPFFFSEECNTRAAMSHIQTLWSLAYWAVRGFLHLDCF